MIAARALTFPRSARLLKSKEFRFDALRRFDGGPLFFYYTVKGSGRVGISISKRLLRNAVDRNRVRRLVREAFRLHRAQLCTVDVHIVGRPGLAEQSRQWKRQDVTNIFDAWITHL